MNERIRVDTELLEKLAGEIHDQTGTEKDSAGRLINEIMRQIAGTSYSELRIAGRADAFADRELQAETERNLFRHADKLLALSRAFRAVDDEAITTLTAILGESFLGRLYRPPAYPDIPGFEPFYIPQTRMAISDWVFMYEQGSEKSKWIVKYTTGFQVKNIVGTWTDPKGNVFYVVDLGNGKFGYIPKRLLSEPIDYLKIPNRDGRYSDGSVVEDSSLPSPWGDQHWPEGWDGPPSSGERHLTGDPVQQNLCLKNMGLVDIDGNRITTLCETPHYNLCGELSVLASLGYTDLSKGLSVFANKVPGGLAILKNIKKGTNMDQMVQFYRALGCEASASCGTMPSPDTLAEGLASGKKYLFGTKLDVNHTSETFGFLTDSPTHADHWVTLTDVFQDSTGDVFVQVYNPYMNREEIYTWDSFVKTCDTPSDGGLSRFTYVEAKPESGKP